MNGFVVQGNICNLLHPSGLFIIIIIIITSHAHQRCIYLNKNTVKTEMQFEITLIFYYIIKCNLILNSIFSSH